MPMCAIFWQSSALVFFLFPCKTEMQQPAITAAPSNPTEVLEGENITLEWRYNLSGRPLELMRLHRTGLSGFIVQKLGNNLRIRSTFISRVRANVTDAFSFISFVGVVRDDDGDYQLDIQNDDENSPFASKEIRLRVLFPPSFNSFSPDQVVVESDPATITLSCSADGNPPPTVNWTRVFDNESDSDVLFTGNSYVINNNRNNAGTYRCKADNGIGSAINQTIRVTVNFKPENVQLTLSDSNICQGDVFNISCSADGNPPVLTYLLFENDTLLNTSGSSLVTRTASAGGVLVYRCEANNTVGTANATTTVTVNEASVIQALINITVIESENSSLTCHVSGTPMPSVSWTEVRAGDRTEGSIRSLINVSRSDAGEYKCEASNFCGNDSKRTFVIVNFKPEDVQLTRNVTANKACLNDVVFFNCSAANANPPVALYQFFENDVLFGSSSSGHFSKKVMNSGNLTYKCVANNTAGTTSSQDVSLTVNVHASIQLIEDPFVIGSRNTSLICNASGTPRPTVFWINVASGLRTNSSVLEFTNINRNEAGEYRCEASNECGSAVEAVNVTVQYPPENVVLTTNATANRACQNDVVSFTCSAHAVPSAMSLQLFKDNVPMEISASGMCVKTLSEVGMFDYKCVANNSIGSASSTNVNIAVNVPSTIQPLQNKTITEGGNLNLSCNASGSPSPVVSWVRISTGQRFDVSVLQLININRSEARDYRCEASNECGNASEAQNIDVQYKPENVQLTTNASANKACQNDILKLTCSVGDANPKVTSFQLFQNGSDVGESNTRMWVKTLSNSGLLMYKCVANNSVGSSESPSVFITVNVPPTIASILDKTVNETDNLTLDCVATGVPLPFVSWVKVSSGQRTNGSLLQLTNTRRSQAGEYRCEASNECGNVVKTGNITVPFKPENVRLVATNIGDEACQNDSVSLSCSADASPPVSSYQFFENDVLLGRNNSGMWTTSLSSSGMLIYRCVASNLVGAANSANVSIDVGVPSSIQSTQNETLVEGSSRNLTCSASGIPPPTVAWIEEGSGQRTPGNVLRLIDIYRNQNGEYRCEARNRCGNKSVTTFVHVLYPPVITHISKNQTLNAGSSVTLNCLADGNPPPVISWTRVSYDSAVVFPLTNIGLQREGTYRCTANNSVGSAVTGDVSIVVHFPPLIEPLEGRKVVVRGESLTLFCNVSGNPAPVVFWTHVESNDKLNNSKWEIKDATERDVGRYQCDAINIYGHASDTTEIVLLQSVTPFSTTVSSDTGMLNKDVIYGPVIGVLGLIVISALIYLVLKHRRRHRADRQYDNQNELHRSHLNQGFQNESTSNGEREIPGPRHYMELGEVTELLGESAETGKEASPYLEINEYAPLHPATRSWEVERENVTIEKVIGKGAFGQVAQGTASELRGRDGTTRVAIKMLKDNARETDREDLMSELEMMKRLKPHPHVIKLMGCVTESDPILVIIEYVPYGDLLGYLRKSRGLNDTYFKDPDVKPQTSLMSQQLMKFSWHVAEGMRYLSSKNIIHRDLAARNVLVGEQEVCKVTDFGMARDVNQENIYQKKSKGRIPVKWTAYEALLYGLYTTKSDVWSFGVVLYEIFTVGGSPYPRTEGRKIYSLLSQGYRMPKPSHVDDTLYQIMLSCWQEDPDNRPTFEILGRKLKEMENQHKRLINMKDYDKKLYENVEDLMI